VVSYYTSLDPETDFTKIGRGSLGGKARGLVFISTLLRRYPQIQEKFPDVDILVPRTLVITTEGDPAMVAAAESLLAADHWYARELSLYWARTLRRLDLSARSIVTLILPGSCFAGVLAELVWAADRALMLDGEFEDSDGFDGQAPEGQASLLLTGSNDGPMPMANGLTRLESRFYGDDEALKVARGLIGETLHCCAVVLQQRNQRSGI